MEMSQISQFDVMSLVINFLITISSLYSAYINLWQRKISKYGFDAGILWLLGLFNKKQSALVRKKPNLIYRMGVMMFLVGVGGCFTVTTKFLESIWPYI